MNFLLFIYVWCACVAYEYTVAAYGARTVGYLYVVSDDVAIVRITAYWGFYLHRLKCRAGEEEHLKILYFEKPIFFWR
jgi:hypothetical protein